MNRLEWLFIAALVLYSFVIWFHKIKQKLRPWMVWLFGAGLAADIGGTIFLCTVKTKSFAFTLHTVCGFASLLIMMLHFFWALSAIIASDKFEVNFKRFSLYAWCLWLVAFISGIPL